MSGLAVAYLHYEYSHLPGVALPLVPTALLLFLSFEHSELDGKYALIGVVRMHFVDPQWREICC